jgi:hypothetical protein
MICEYFFMSGRKSESIYATQEIVEGDAMRRSHPVEGDAMRRSHPVEGDAMRRSHPVEGDAMRRRFVV